MKSRGKLPNVCLSICIIAFLNNQISVAMNIDNTKGSDTESGEKSAASFQEAVHCVIVSWT
jgi:hypothetical protein